MAVLNRVTNAAWLLVPITHNAVLFFNIVAVLLQHFTHSCTSFSMLLSFFTDFLCVCVWGGGDEATSLISPQFKNHCPHIVFPIGLNM